MPEMVKIASGGGPPDDRPRRIKVSPDIKNLTVAIPTVGNVLDSSWFIWKNFFCSHAIYIGSSAMIVMVMSKTEV